MAGQKQARKPGPAAARGSKPGGPASRAGQRPQTGQGQETGQGNRKPQGNRNAQNDRTTAGRSAAVAGGETEPRGFWRKFSPGAMGALPFTALALSVLGVIPSAYLTYTHFNQTALAGCPDTGAINCELVTNSPESKLFGVLPVSVLGLLFFLFLVAVNLPWAWRSPRREIHWLRLGSVVVGMIMVLYLVYTEIITLGAICLYCTSVHIITFLLFGVLVFQATSRNSPLTARR
jgi:uncharacterized membrane protein